MEGYVVFPHRRVGSQRCKGIRMLPSKANAVSFAAKTSVLVRRRCDGVLLPSGRCQVRNRWIFQAGTALRGLWFMCPLKTFLPHSLWTGHFPVVSERWPLPMSRERSIHQSMGPRGECLALGRASHRLTSRRPVGPAGDLPACVPPMGHGVLPSSVRPGLSWFQFGDLFLCKMSGIHGWGRGISRVI